MAQGTNTDMNLNGRTPPVPADDGPKSLDDVSASLVIDRAPAKEPLPRTQDGKFRRQQDAAEPPIETRSSRRNPADDAHDAGADADVVEDRQNDEFDELPQDQGEDESDPFLSLFDDGEEGTPTYEDGEPEDVDEDGRERLYRVTVEGQEREVSLRDLQRAYSGGQAVEQRLQQVEELRTQLFDEARERDAASQALAQRVRQVYEHFNQVLISPKVDPPDPATQHTDPIGYLQQEAAYRADQDRMRLEHAQLQQLQGQMAQQFEQQKQELIRSEAQKLRTRIPKLADPAFAEHFRRGVAETALSIGFTPEEVSQTIDHRLLILAAKAAAYDRLDASMKASKQAGKETAQARTRRRPMAVAGSNRPVGTKGARKQSFQRKAMAKARETGSVDDVALTLLT